MRNVRRVLCMCLLFLRRSLLRGFVCDLFEAYRCLREMIFVILIVNQFIENMFSNQMIRRIRSRYDANS